MTKYRAVFLCLACLVGWHLLARLLPAVYQIVQQVFWWTVLILLIYQLYIIVRAYIRFKRDES